MCVTTLNKVNKKLKAHEGKRRGQDWKERTGEKMEGIQEEKVTGTQGRKVERREEGAVG